MAFSPIGSVIAFRLNACNSPASPGRTREALLPPPALETGCFLKDCAGSHIGLHFFPHFFLRVSPHFFLLSSPFAPLRPASLPAYPQTTHLTHHTRFLPPHKSSNLHAQSDPSLHCTEDFHLSPYTPEPMPPHPPASAGFGADGSAIHSPLYPAPSAPPPASETASPPHNRCPDTPALSVSCAVFSNMPTAFSDSGLQSG